MNDIKDLSTQVYFNSLTYYFKSKDSSPINVIIIFIINFIKAPLHLYRSILNGNTELAKTEKIKFK